MFYVRRFSLIAFSYVFLHIQLYRALFTFISLLLEVEARVLLAHARLCQTNMTRGYYADYYYTLFLVKGNTVYTKNDNYYFYYKIARHIRLFKKTLATALCNSSKLKKTTTARRKFNISPPCIIDDLSPKDIPAYAAKTTAA